jgi:hypothetical protein
MTTDNVFPNEFPFRDDDPDFDYDDQSDSEKLDLDAPGDFEREDTDPELEAQIEEEDLHEAELHDAEVEQRLELLLRLRNQAIVSESRVDRASIEAELHELGWEEED